MMIDTAIVVAVITGILGPIMVVFINARLTRKKKGDMVTDALAVSDKIMHKLDHIKDEYKADRVWLAQFHNGGHFYPTGKSIAKFSMVYELVETTTKSIQSSFQNIPVSLFSKPINRLLERNAIEIYDYENETIATYGLKYIAEEAGSKSTYMFAIKTIDNKFIGILTLDYTRKKQKLEHEAITTILNHATAIGGVLNTHLQKH
jgi:hypothetical protein